MEEDNDYLEPNLIRHDVIQKNFISGMTKIKELYTDIFNH